LESPDSSMKQKSNTTRPPKTNQNQDNGKVSETSAIDWLKVNWITYILTPLIIVIFVGGCIVFVVFMMKTKEEQDNFQREERRRNEDRRNAYQPATNSNSAESLI
ncbi:hypothetical protein PENTCL1PPCAC_3343, partial [Pristionchus entomophagus]